MSAVDAATSPSPESSRTQTLQSWVELTGRILLGVLFLLSGVGKISGYEATSGYMTAMGVPAGLLPVVIGFEVLGALLVFLGWKTRIVAFLLAGFSLVTGAVFHSNFADQVQMVMFLKNVSIAGGFLLLVAKGAGPYSIDARR